MSQCPQCGAPTRDGQAFCGECGTNLASAEAERTVIRPSIPPAEPPIWVAREQPTAQFPAQPPYQPQPQLPPAAPSAPAHANINLSWLLKGNWVGAALTAGVTFGVALVVSLITAFTTAEDLDIASAFGMTGLLTEATFGVDFTQSSGSSSVYYGHIPTLATLLSLLAAVFVFRRVTARYPSWKPALGDAGRAAFILAAVLTMLAIVLKVAEPDLHGYESQDELEDLDGANSFSEYLARSMSRAGLATSVDGKTTSSMAGAIFLGLVLLLLVLALASFLRRDWLDATSARVHEWLSAPLAGFGALVLGLTATGLVYVVAILIGQEPARDLNEVAGLIAVLPSLGLRLLGLGSGAEFGIRINGDATGDEESLQRLAGFADDNGAGFWLAPVVAIALALGAVYVVIRRSSDRSRVQRNVLVYLGLILVVLPILIRFANFHLQGEEEKEDYSIFGGVDGFQTTMLFFLISLGAAAVMLLVTGNLDLATLKSKASAFAQSVQTNPGQPGQPQPPYGRQPPQQWSGPPPGPPPGPPVGLPPGPPPQGPPPGPPPQGPPPGWQPPPGPPPQGPPPGWQPPPQR